MDLEYFKVAIKKLREQPPAPILIELRPEGFEILREHIDNTNKTILDNYSTFFGARVYVNYYSDLNFYQARITYTDGEIKIIDILKDKIF